MGVLGALALLAPGQASADIGQKIIRACATGQSLAGYTQSDYAKALKEMRASTEEYSACTQEIREAKEAAARAGRHGSTTTGSAAAPTALTATPAEQQSITQATTGSAPVRLGGLVVHPGVVHANISSALSTLPDPLLALLALVVACLLTVAGGAVRKRVREHRAD